MRHLRTNAERGFTLVEILVVVTLLSLLAFISFPRISSRFAQTELLLQRSVNRLIAEVPNSSGLRLSVGQNGKMFAQQRIIDEEGKPVWDTLSQKWLEFRGQWKVQPEHCYFYSDGTCSPWSLEYDTGNDNVEKFFITVTGTVYRSSSLN